jgi:hypothetical protein
MRPNILYRGDRKGNSTRPEWYRKEGLFTKLINGGNPAYITEAGLFETIRIHIAPETTQERAIQSTSRFLSFSSSKKKALYFAASGSRDILIPCDEGSATRYLFTLNISSRSTGSDAGVYVLEFQIGRQRHTLLLLNAATFLKTHPAKAKSGNALKNAKRDLEWLVMPIDYIKSLKGFSARIPISSIWTGECFLLESEMDNLFYERDL